MGIRAFQLDMAGANPPILHPPAWWAPLWDLQAAVASDQTNFGSHQMTVVHQVPRYRHRPLRHQHLQCLVPLALWKQTWGGVTPTKVAWKEGRLLPNLALDCGSQTCSYGMVVCRT